MLPQKNCVAAFHRWRCSSELTVNALLYHNPWQKQAYRVALDLTVGHGILVLVGSQ